MSANQQHTATPRTDEACKVQITWERFQVTGHVPADFARQLERENADLLAALQTIADGDTMRRRGIQWTHGDTVENYQRIARAAIAKATA